MKRALAIGVGLGALAAVSNFYVSLRTGWSLPVMTTAALVGAAVFRQRRPPPPSGDPRGKDLTVLTATTSAAGYMAGGGNAAALPAFVMLLGSSAGAPSLAAMTIAWIAIAILGTTLAPFLRQRTIDGESPLAFPTATATAAIASSIATSSAGEDVDHASTGSSASRVLWRSALGAAAFALVRNLARVPATIAAPGWYGALTFGIDPSFVLVGAGALMTMRTAASTLIGGVFTYAILVPSFLRSGIVGEASYRASVIVMVWPSAALLVASALTSFVIDLPKVLGRGGGGAGSSAPRQSSRAIVLLAVIAIVTLAVMTFLLSLPLVFVLLGLPIAAVLAFVAARAMGETDIVPTKALTPLAQLFFGALPAASLATTTLLPNMTSGVALHAADTLGSLKVAKATGTSQSITIAARILGVIVGGVAVAIAYALVVGENAAATLPSKELPVPAVLVWKSVASLSIEGLHALPSAVTTAMIIAAMIGIALSILERVLPPRFVSFLPSAVGLGSGMVLPASNAIAIFLGAIGSKAFFAKSDARKALVIPIASGLIAGESLVGIAWQAATILWFH